MTQTDVTAASVAADSQTHLRPSEEIINETPKQEPVRDDDEEVYDGDFLEERTKELGRRNIGSVASAYLVPTFTIGGFSTPNTVYERTAIYLRLTIPPHS